MAEKLLDRLIGAIGAVSAKPGTNAVNGQPAPSNQSSVPAPTFWQAFANPNISQEYYQGLNQRALQQMVGQQASSLSGQQAGQQQQFANLQAALQKDKDLRDSVLTLAQKTGTPIANDDELTTFASKIFPGSVQNTLAQQTLAGTQLGQEQNVLNSKTGQEATRTGFLASQEAPYGDLLGKVLGNSKFTLGESMPSIPLPGIGNIGFQGNVPVGTSTEHEMSMGTDAQGRPVQQTKEATRNAYKMGGGGLNPEIEETDEDKAGFGVGDGNSSNLAPPSPNSSGAAPTATVTAKPAYTPQAIPAAFSGMQGQLSPQMLNAMNQLLMQSGALKGLIKAQPQAPVAKPLTLQDFFGGLNGSTQ